jgi:hypothetical protein
MLRRRAFLTGALAGLTTPAWAPPLGDTIRSPAIDPNKLHAEFIGAGEIPSITADQIPSGSTLMVELPEQSVGNRLWFLQVNCQQGLPAPAIGYEFGRCEVTVKGEFAGCFLAATYKQGIDDMLAPMSVGFAIWTERSEDIEVKLYGALALACKPDIKITEMKR